MSIVNVTPVGAYVDAIRVATAADRRSAARRSMTAPRMPERSRRRSGITTVQQAFARAVKIAGPLRAAATLRSRPV